MPTYFVCSYFVQDIRGVKMVATPNILYFYFKSKDKNPYEISYLQFANRFDLSLIVSKRNINRDTNFKSKLYAVFPLNSFKKVNNQLFFVSLIVSHIVINAEIFKIYFRSDFDRIVSLDFFLHQFSTYSCGFREQSIKQTHPK